MSTWHSILETQQISIDEQGYSYSPAPVNPALSITPLTHLGLFSVIGPDAEKFLQGQISCDMRDISNGFSRLASHNNVKGSMISLSRVIPAEGGFWLRTNRQILSNALTALNKYMMFSKADGKDISDTVVGLGIQGSDAASALAALGNELPAEADQFVTLDGGVLVKVAGERYELWLEQAQAEAALEQLLKSGSLTGSESWLLSEIQQGIPSLTPDTLETFIPQMTNLQAFEGVSFRKGCYTGQEIITRLQHRGKLKRPMFRLSVQADTAPAAGTVLATAARASVGNVVCSAPSGDGEYQLLAVMLKDVFDDASQSLHLETQEGPQLERLDLPYTLDPELFEAKR
ncbi:CAF17-like 4Fe-4S cluster assembly/insertion protein YgfZ [Aliamphritea spongicola]|uniref:CAF17-like 4Fe-4S cluster assembly/insertion protein YgfZ n=1 Tax=Aliamphritea spongicola TaxID=707589 RepID=UPI00196A1E32|nr:folate-binding protein YgfZ [Aliamphritea spongicola]MBN3563953.1 folate-binding protein YgfZ [Aliamphritea spongicola]